MRFCCGQRRVTCTLDTLLHALKIRCRSICDRHERYIIGD